MNQSNVLLIISNHYHTSIIVKTIQEIMVINMVVFININDFHHYTLVIDDT